jgi:sugar/nucleoside kinase (ribokinase family)
VDVIAFGTVFLEVVFGEVPALPGPGEEIYTRQFAYSCGGGAVTVATAASQLGVPAGMSALLGDDLGSRVVEQHCRRAGVDLTASRYLAGPVTGVSVVVNFAGDRAFISHIPPHPDARRRDIQEWLEVLRAHRPRWCYVHAGPGVDRFIDGAHSLGVRVALGLTVNDITEDAGAVAACVRLADVFLPNEEELLALTGTGTLAAALDRVVTWCSCVVVTRGADGAVVAQPDSTTYVRDGIVPVVVRDRTGAGDAFAGALIGALCRGASITEAAAAGNTAGSRTVGLLGAVGEVAMDELWVMAPALAGALQNQPRA